MATWASVLKLPEEEHPVDKSPKIRTRKIRDVALL